jgi:putative transposase
VVVGTFDLVPRPLRPAYPGAVYHVTARGNNKERIFLDAGDRRRLDQLLATLVHRRRWRCHAACQMGNHYHLLLETPDADISPGMQWLNGVFAQDFNRRHGHSGHVFQGRFHSELVEREAHFLEASRYIVRNPIRAKLCREPAEWDWSSYRATAGLDGVPPHLTPKLILEHFSADGRRARKLYADFVADGWP